VLTNTLWLCSERRGVLQGSTYHVVEITFEDLQQTASLGLFGCGGLTQGRTQPVEFERPRGEVSPFSPRRLNTERQMQAAGRCLGQTTFDDRRTRNEVGQWRNKGTGR
jgi:hypothetical protein